MLNHVLLWTSYLHNSQLQKTQEVHRADSGRASTWNALPLYFLIDFPTSQVGIEPTKLKVSGSSIEDLQNSLDRKKKKREKMKKWCWRRENVKLQC